MYFTSVKFLSKDIEYIDNEAKRIIIFAFACSSSLLLKCDPIPRKTELKTLFLSDFARMLMYKLMQKYGVKIDNIIGRVNQIKIERR